MLVREEVVFFFARDVEVGFGGVGGAQVEVFVDSVPVGAVEGAFAEKVEGGTCHDGDVCDHEARVVGWEVRVNGIGEHSVPVVQEEDYAECDSGAECQLNPSPELVMC